MATHQKVRSILKKAKIPVGHYTSGKICPRFVGGDVIVSQPCSGIVNVMLYRKRDEQRLEKIASILREAGFYVVYLNQHLFLHVE